MKLVLAKTSIQINVVLLSGSPKKLRSYISDNNFDELHSNMKYMKLKIILKFIRIFPYSCKMKDFRNPF